MARIRSHISAEKRRQARKIIILQLLGEECVRCLATDNLVCDHINPKTKSFNIGINWSKSLKVIIIELRKCQLLCKSCHGKKTALERGRKLATHGSQAKYSYGCRCNLCKSAHTSWARERRLNARN